MTWQTGTAASHIEIQNAIRNIATGRHVSALALNAGGTGYVAGDILTVAGGTSSYAATIEVLTVASGVIATFRINTGGAYTVDPTTTANAVTGGTGSGATFDLTMTATGWTVRRESERVASVSLNAAGTNYAVGEILTLVGGLGVGSSSQVVAATFTVDSISGGGGTGPITAVSLTTGGNYEEPLGTLTNVSVTSSGGGINATVDVTFEVISDSNKWLVMDGAAGGAGDEVTVGFRTYEQTANGGGNSANMQAIGFENFNASLLIEQQTGVSPGLETAALNFGGVSDTEGSFIPLVESAGTDMEFWFSITDRRILGIVKTVQGLTIHYSSFYAGFLNQFGTAAEKPYPIYIAGSSSRSNTRFNEAPPSLISGLTECYKAATEDGPAYYRRSTDGTWIEVVNGSQNEGNGSRSSLNSNTAVYPYGKSDTPTNSNPGWDQISDDGGFSWEQLIPSTISTPTRQLIPTTNSGGDLRLLVPATIMITDTTNPPFELAGEMEGVFYFDFTDPNNLGSPEGVSEDTFTQGSDKFRIFQNGNRAEAYSFMAIRED